MKNKVVLIDYSSFKKGYQYYKNSITELLDFLRKQHVEIYALLDIHSLETMPSIDASCIYGIISFDIDKLYRQDNSLINEIHAKTRMYDNKNILVVSNDLLLINLLAESNFNTCLIEKNYTDELSEVYKNTSISKRKALFK